MPLGKACRVGIVEDVAENAELEETKAIIEAIDEAPVLPSELWNTIKYFAKNWFVGVGTAAKCLLPTAFFDGEPLGELLQAQSISKSQAQAQVKYFYEPRDEKRYEMYIEQSKAISGTLFLFPEVASASVFWNLLPDELKAKGVLFPAANQKKQWEIWKGAREGKYEFVVGSPAAAFVPLKNLSRIVIDEEQSGAWQTQKYPIYHIRALLSVRARFAKASLWLGGRMPSSKAAMQCDAPCEGAQKRLVFVDLHDASAFDLKGLKEEVAISKPLLRETVRAKKEGKFALWLLDRRGFAGEIFCDECGESLRCEKCGGILRWEAKKQKLVCKGCANVSDLPERCPVCGGLFLEGVRPGIEAIYEKATPMLKYLCDTQVLLLDEKLPAAAALAKEYPYGAVLIGTRKMLSLATTLNCKLVAWLDLDGQARGEEYDAKERAFSLVLESVWRGVAADERTVVIQSRRPARDWQEGLKRGWKVFWEKELKARAAFELPPFVPMLEIQMPKNRGKRFAQELENARLEFIEGETCDHFFVRTKQFALLRKILKPYYNIQNTRTGMPKVFLKLS